MPLYTQWTSQSMWPKVEVCLDPAKLPKWFYMGTETEHLTVALGTRAWSPKVGRPLVPAGTWQAAAAPVG